MAVHRHPDFGRYILVSKLGMGGMAEVFKAQFKGKPELIVAIKRILPQFSQDKKLISMLVNEARLSMGLSHPSIVPVLDFGMVDGDYFMAMEYVRGKDLKSIMIRCKSKKIDLPFQMSVFTLIRVLRALHFAHAKRDNFDQPLQIVHRDVSPHNILISFLGEVKILDFGIAKAASLAGTTQSGILKGKFSYMSPEQSYGENVDHRTDVFSAGIVLWELLTLESYYSAETDIKLLASVREARARNPCEVNPRIPKPLAEIILTALSKKPRKRFQTAEEFAGALEAYQRDAFGVVTEADLGTFVSSLFGISAEEIVRGQQKTGQELVDIVNPPQERTPPEAKRGPLLRSWSLSVPSWAWKIPLIALVLAGAAWALTHHSPGALWRAYNRRIERLAVSFHSGNPRTDSGPVLGMNPPVVPRPAYTVFFAPGARESLEDLPFETYDRVRSRIDDLAADPRPSSAQPVPQRPGFLSVLQAGHRIVFSVADDSSTVTIRQIRIETQRER